MGRWRPAAKLSSPYITAAGARALQAELRHLWKTERPEVVKAITAAAAEGDRSENAEYIYRKKQLGGIDRRIRYLAKRLDRIQVVDRVPEDRHRIRFGAWINLENQDDAALVRYRIVGADEIDAQAGWISVDSPLAKGLLGAGKDDTVRVQTPDGKRRYRVISVSYDEEN
jgi:transcription elongation factor GreB